VPGTPANGRMAWAFLIVAGIMEIGWLAGMKYSQGFTRLWPSVLTVIAMAISTVCAAQAMRTIPAGTVYAVWTGIGGAGAAVMGILLFNESREWLRLASIGLIVMGIVGLKLNTPD
jgi:quaternary ammonium compound-resistance protein SugE